MEDFLKHGTICQACPPSSPTQPLAAGPGFLPAGTRPRCVQGQMCGSGRSQGGSVLTQRESVHTSQGLDVPPSSSSQAPSQKGTSGPRDAWASPAGPVGLSLMGTEMGHAAVPPSHRTLCWASMTQLGFGADSLSGGGPITWFCLHSIAPLCQPRGDRGKTEGGGGARDHCGGPLAPACLQNPSSLSPL